MGSGSSKRKAERLFDNSSTTGISAAAIEPDIHVSYTFMESEQGGLLDLPPSIILDRFSEKSDIVAKIASGQVASNEVNQLPSLSQRLRYLGSVAESPACLVA